MIYRDYLKDKNQNSIKFKEVEGSSPLAFSHSKGRDLKNYQIYGNSTQKTTGKNLISSLPYYYHTPDDNFSVIFEKGKTYTFSFESSTSSKWRLMIWGTEIDGSDLNTGSNGYLQGMYCSAAAPNRLQDNADRTTNSYTYLCNKSFVAVRIAFWNTDNGASDTITNPQLELGPTATEYEAYHTSPSPEFPSEVESVGDLTTKNLLDYTTVSTRSGTTAAFIDNGFVYTGNYYFAFDGSFLEIGSTYVMSWNFEGDDTLTPTWRLAYEDGTYSSIVRNGVSLKIAQSVSKILVYPEMSKTTYTTTFTNIQLEEGSTATEYEPYHKYDVPITVCGKNLFDFNETLSVTKLLNRTPPELYVIEAGQTYTLSCYIDNKSNVSGKARFRLSVGYDSSKYQYNYTEYINAASSGVAIVKFTVPNDYNGNLALQFTTTEGTAIFSKFMLSYYDDVEYEPYKGKTTVHIYLDEPLRKVGDYADYIDFKNQKIVRNIVEDSLYANAFYKKLSSVARFGRTKTNIKQKLDTHMLSTILNYDFSWYKDVESIFHHNGAYYNYYWSVYWSRLGLTYDGTNVYRTDDTEQTPLTNSEVLNIANEWLNTLSDEDKKVFMILDTPTEEPISLPTLKTVKGTSIMSVNTSIQPSNIKIKYIRM